MTPFRLRYFADENLLALAKLLIREGREDVLHPGHADLPEIPLGTLDVDWMPVVAQRGLVVLTRDRHIRTRPAELRAYLDLGIRSVWLGARRDLAPPQQLDMFLAHENRLQREVIKRGPGPWALSMSPTGLKPLGLRED